MIRIRIILIQLILILLNTYTIIGLSSDPQTILIQHRLFLGGLYQKGFSVSGSTATATCGWAELAQSQQRSLMKEVIRNDSSKSVACLGP